MCALAIATCCIGAPSALAASPLVSVTPGLFPAFRAAIPDYAVRCEPQRTVTVSVAAPADTAVAVDGHPARSGTFDVPVTLAAGQRFAFTVETLSRTTTHHVRCLPEQFPQWEARRLGATQAAYHFLTLDEFAVAFDRYGVPVWWWQQVAGVRALDFKRLPDGTLAWGDQFERRSYASDPRSRYQQRRLDGQLVREIKAVGVPVDFHDLVRLPNGNFLILAYRPREHVDLSADGGPSDARVVDGEVQEITPSGSLVWSWNSKDHVTTAETGRWLPWRRTPPAVPADGTYDLVHLNAVEPTADGNVLVSARNLDAVYKIDRSTGEVIWKLGGTTTAKSLVLPAGATPIGAQHDMRELPDGTITIHDNGSDMNRPPRSVRFSIDEAAGTATPVEELYDPEVPRSSCCGSSRRLPGGNWAMSWGGSTLVTELTAAGERVFELKLERGVTSYRDNAIPVGVMTPSSFRDGMDAQFPRPPLNTVAPAISGAPQVGQTLHATTGEWSPPGETYGFAWWRCDSDGCTELGGADATDDDGEYTLTTDDFGRRIRVVVTATNGFGSAAHRSAATRTVGAPVNVAAPTISGVAQVGRTFEATAGEWDPPGDSYRYRWLRCEPDAVTCIQIGGADATDGNDTYTPTSGMRGKRLRVVVTATNAAGRTEHRSAASRIIGLPVNVGAPTIGGVARVGQTLVATAGEWEPPGTSYGYRWLRCGADGATCVQLGGADATDGNNAYTPTSGDLGSRIRVVVTATNAAGATQKRSSATRAVAA